MNDRARPHPFFDVGATALLISLAGDTSDGAQGGTATAYRRAADRGCRAFQVDVVPTVAGELLSMHAVLGRRPALERGDLAGADVTGIVTDDLETVRDAVARRS